MTPTTIEPMKYKITAVLKLPIPTFINRKEALIFIGAVNYFKSMRVCCAHIRASMDEYTDNQQLSWSNTKTKAFKVI